MVYQSDDVKNEDKFVRSKERRNLVYNKVAKHQPVTSKTISFLVKHSIVNEKHKRDKIVSNILYALKREGKLYNEQITKIKPYVKHWFIVPKT